jgi:hypothetical protein
MSGIGTNFRGPAPKAIECVGTFRGSKFLLSLRHHGRLRHYLTDDV